MRKSWDQHWIEEAYHAAEMSTCASGRHVGAVIVRNNRLLSTGFNGVPHNYPHPTVCVRRELGYASGEGLDKCACSHAERNAINNAARAGIALEGSILYCTAKPCVFCMGDLANVGIVKVVYCEEYSHSLSQEIANYAQIDLIQYEHSKRS